MLLNRSLLASLFVTLAFTLAACNNTSLPNYENDETLSNEQEFTFSPDLDLASLQLTPVYIYAPRLVVRLGIFAELDNQGNPTGKRYGQATFIWTDKSAARGGSDLSGSVSIFLREVGQTNTKGLWGDYQSVLSNRDLMRQADYQGHIVKTQPSSSIKPLCVEIRDRRLDFEPSRSFELPISTSTPIIYCEPNKTETKADMQFTSAINLATQVPTGMPALMSPRVMNAGPRPAKDVYVTFKVNNIMRFVEDGSGLFECSSRPLEDVIYTEEVTCYAQRFPVGVWTLPLVFERTNAPWFMIPITGSLQASITTQSLESNYDNNSANFSATFSE